MNGSTVSSVFLMSVFLTISALSSRPVWVGFGGHVRPTEERHENFWKLFSREIESLFKTERIQLRSTSAVNTSSILDVLPNDVTSTNVTSRRDDDDDVCKHGGKFSEPTHDGDACCRTWVTKNLTIESFRDKRIFFRERVSCVWIDPLKRGKKLYPVWRADVKKDGRVIVQYQFYDEVICGK